MSGTRAYQALQVEVHTLQELVALRNRELEAALRDRDAAAAAAVDRSLIAMVRWALAGSPAGITRVGHVYACLASDAAPQVAFYSLPLPCPCGHSVSPSWPHAASSWMHTVPSSTRPGLRLRPPRLRRRPLLWLRRSVQMGAAPCRSCKPWWPHCNPTWPCATSSWHWRRSGQGRAGGSTCSPAGWGGVSKFSLSQQPPSPVHMHAYGRKTTAHVLFSTFAHARAYKHAGHLFSAIALPSFLPTAKLMLTHYPLSLHNLLQEGWVDDFLSSGSTDVMPGTP